MCAGVWHGVLGVSDVGQACSRGLATHGGCIQQQACARCRCVEAVLLGATPHRWWWRHQCWLASTRLCAPSSAAMVTHCFLGSCCDASGSSAHLIMKKPRATAASRSQGPTEPRSNSPEGFSPSGPAFSAPSLGVDLIDSFGLNLDHAAGATTCASAIGDAARCKRRYGSSLQQ